MKRSIKRSLVRPATPNPTPEGDTSESLDKDLSDATPPAFKRAAGGAGSAWKAGAAAQAQAGLDEARDQLSKDILAGNHVLEIAPDLISDPIGSDRRDDWMEQEDFRSLVESIQQNGQDTPITVWPADPDWHPDPLDPTNLEGVQFLLLAGRRRCAAAQELGRPVRAVFAPTDGQKNPDHTFQMLVLRFRENEEREALGAFERLLSIGQMFDTLQATSEAKLTAVAFARRVGVHESIVSRARAVLKQKMEILNAFKNAYDMSFHELQRATSQLSKAKAEVAQSKAKSQKLSVVRKVGSRNLSIASIDGKLSIKTTGVKLDKSGLEGLGDLIAAYLQEQGPTK